jgi:hypothetical protein
MLLIYVGNSHEGNLDASGAMDGQGLHFKWGDGAVFRCKGITVCFTDDRMVVTNGTFFHARRLDRHEEMMAAAAGRAKKGGGGGKRRRRQRVRREEDEALTDLVTDDGWYRGQTNSRRRRHGVGQMYYLNGDK